LGGRQWPAIGAGRERWQRGDMARFRSLPRLFDLTDSGGGVGEVYRDGPKGLLVRPDLACPCQIGLAQLLDLPCRCGILVLGAGEIEYRINHESGWLGTFEENEVLVLPHGIQGDEVQFVPECVDLALFRLIEDQLAQWLVIAVVAVHQVKASAKEASLG